MKTHSEKPTFCIDCEFDGHNGPLLSIAMVPLNDPENGVYIKVSNVQAQDKWVCKNVVPIMNEAKCRTVYDVPLLRVGETIRYWLNDKLDIRIISDSPVDIYRFCHALMTSSQGEWKSCGANHMVFEVHNVDTYPCKIPGAIQHNAWWDAMALADKLRGKV